MRFLGSKFTQNALAAEAPPRTPLGELKRSPDLLADFRGPLRGRGKGREGKEAQGGEGRGNRGIGEGKRRGKGSEEGREGKGKEQGKGGEGEFASLALGV